MLVKDIMKSEVPTIPPTAPSANALKTVYNSKAGCAVVVDDVPTGIVTKSDLLVAAYKANGDLETVPVEKAMTHPMESIGPNAPVQSAIRQMDRNGFKHLPVVEDYDLVGVITPETILDHLDELMNQVRRDESRKPEGW